MTYDEYIKQAIENFSEERITTDTLKEAAHKANDDLSLDGVILDGIIAALETRMNEEEFINFCEELL